MAGLAELVDRAVALPPGPELSAALDALPWEKVPNTRLVEVAQARSRQLAHDQAELFADLVEITHAVAVADLPDDKPGDRAEAVARAGKHVRVGRPRDRRRAHLDPHRRRPGTRVRHRPV